MIMKTLKIFLLLLILSSCSSDFLEKDPYGQLTEDQILEEENLESLIIGAYSVLNGQIDEGSNAFNSPASNWSFGDVVSDDAYKGGGGTGDQNNVHLMEIFNTNPAVVDIERKWKALYEGVRRANHVLYLLQSSSLESSIKDQRTAEMKFLRGHFYFELKKIYNRIPYLDENAQSLEDFQVSNTAMTSEQIWSAIEKDFSDAATVLPATQDQKGRPSRFAAKAYLAKAYLYQQKWTEALAAAEDVIMNGGYELMPNFSDVFLPENDNGSEIIFSIQYSINDGNPRNYNGSIGDRLMPPGGPRYPAYGFLRPTQNLVNSFATDASGLPTVAKSDLTLEDSCDPRIDITLGRPGVPYLDLGIVYESSWARDLATYGPYGPKKRMISANSSAYLPTWPYVTALNYYIIRYADVLLWAAESKIMLGDLEGGKEYINMVRSRTKNGSTVMSLDGTTTAAKYNVGLYSSFSSQDEAIQALQTERRLELAHEGHRFFDLVRWGIADKVMNGYIANEKEIRPYLVGANFVKGKHEYFPIPQSQVDLGGFDASGQPLIEQNPGY